MDAQRFVNLMRLRKVKCPVVYQCALYQSWLKKRGIESQVIQGYVNIAGQGCCRHFWVRTSEGDVDIATMISAPMMKNLLKLSDEPLGQVFDHDNVAADNEAKYELYVQDPKKFWSESPVKNFRLS